MRDARDVIIEPVVTEHSTLLAAEQDAYTFVVAPDANKPEIRRAVAELFDVDVRKVRTMNMPGKVRRVGRHIGRRPGYKKAIVTLVEGEQIDLYEGV